MVMIYNLGRNFWTWLVRKQTNRGGLCVCETNATGLKGLTSSVCSQIRKRLQDNAVEEAGGAFFRQQEEAS